MKRTPGNKRGTRSGQSQECEVVFLSGKREPAIGAHLRVDGARALVLLDIIVREVEILDPAVAMSRDDVDEAVSSR